MRWITRHIKRIFKIKNEDELNDLLGDFDLNSCARESIERYTNAQYINLVKLSIKSAKETKDKTIVSSHVSKSIQKIENHSSKIKQRTRTLEGVKIIGTLGLGGCISHLINNPTPNVFVVFVGLIGALMLGIGLFYNSK